MGEIPAFAQSARPADLAVNGLTESCNDHPGGGGVISAPCGTHSHMPVMRGQYIHGTRADIGA
jgi:hypothetical protein